MPRTEIPETSPEVAKQVFKDFLNDIGGFSSNLYPQIKEDQPVFLDANLEGGTAIMLTEGPLVATLMVAGNLFRYECSRRQLQLRGESLPFIGRDTFVRSLEPVRELRDLVVQFGRSDAMLRRMQVQLANEDPAIGEIVNNLLKKPLEVQRGQGMDAFIQGIHTAHLQLTNIESNPALSSPGVKPSKLPLVQRDLVRQALLLAIQNPKALIDGGLDVLDSITPITARRISRINDDDYQLLAAFTSLCIIGEVQNRDLRPDILEEKSLSHPDPVIADLMQKGATPDDQKKLDELIREFNISTLGEMEISNPHLCWGAMAFLASFEGLDSVKRLTSGLSGVVNQYNTFKSILDFS